jgi:hypothetical protein
VSVVTSTSAGVAMQRNVKGDNYRITRVTQRQPMGYISKEGRLALSKCENETSYRSLLDGLANKIGVEAADELIKKLGRKSFLQFKVT